MEIKRDPGTAPIEVAKAAHFKTEQAAPVATVAELADYDAILIGVSRTRSNLMEHASRAG